MTNAYRLAVALLFLIPVQAPVASASLIIEGDFSIQFAPGPLFSGAFSALFDDSVVTGVGIENFNDLAILTTLSLDTNPINGVAFDTLNTGLDLRFTAGALTGLVIGGLPDVSFFGGAVGADFAVRFTDGISNAHGLRIDDTLYTGADFDGRFISRSVPLPPTLALLALGLLAMRRRTAA